MSLDRSGLETDLTELFANPPETLAGCAQAWAEAIGAYASGIIPASAAVPAATTALQGSLAAAFATPAAAASMDLAFTTFATAVGLGMVGYTPVPPVLPVGFAAQFALPPPETHADAADAFATLIDDWLTTGSATLIAPPNTVVPWS